MRIQLGKKKSGKPVREIEQGHKLARSERRRYKKRMQYQFAAFAGV